MAENSLVGMLNDDVAYLETLIDNQKNETYFYFKVKIIVNKNNSLTLADKVIGIGKNNLFVFWASESQSSKNQGLNSSKKQEINFDLLEFPQQKIPLAKFDQFSLIPNTDPQFISYLKSIIPSFSSQQYPNVCQSFSLLFLESTQQYETQSILCPKYTTGLQMLYVLQMMKSIKSYEEFLEKYDSYSGNRSLLLDKGNLKLMRMMCNAKFGFIDANPQNFGFNCQINYGEIQEKREILLYEQTLSDIIKKSQYQFSDTFNLKIYFKIIDDNSKNYATNFIIPSKDKLEIFHLSGCQVTDQTFESLMLKVKEQSPKGIPFLNRSLPEKLYLPTLKHLNLSKNKLTDGIFSVFCKLICPEKEKVQNGNNHLSSSIKPLFPALISLNLSRNDISLQTESSHDKFINVLENLSSFVLKIDFSHNKISSLDFFEKYFVNADHQAGVPSLPIEFIDLRGNSIISQSAKESFISNYLLKQAQLSDKFMTDIGFIIDLDEITCSRDKNALKYLLLLQNYLKTQKENFFEQIDCFETHFGKLACQYDSSRSKSSQLSNQKRQITLTLSKSQKPLQKSLQFSSSIKTIRNSQLRSPNNNKIPEVQGRMLEQFSKTFYLKDYKTLNLMKNELINSFKVNEKELQKTFSQQLDRKKSQQKIIIELFQRVVNFLDFKGKDGIKTLDEQRSINKKLQRLVGIIRRKGLEGHGSQLVVYLKHLRDQFIESYLVSDRLFSTINPIYDYLKSITTNYTALYVQAKKQKQSFLNVDYLHLANCPFQEIQNKFMDNKKLGLNEFNESVYDRLRYLFMENVILGRILHSSETLIRELKLFPTKVLRDYDKTIRKDSQLKPFLRGKQRLTSRKLGLISNRMQHLRLYSILHYSFNSKITAQISRSAYEGIMSCLNFPQTRQQESLSFIEVVNNFMAFLFYTPDTISEQTVTYINYIVNYLNEMSLETLDDLEWKEFLIEEFYLHLMSFRPEQKLAKGLLLNVFEYFTARLICRNELQKFILAYLLENQTSSLEQSHLILSNLSSSSASTQSLASSHPQSLHHLHKRQTKIQWAIPNNFLLNSFLNQGKLTINIRFDIPLLFPNHPTLPQIELFVHQTTTIKQLVEIVLDSNNLYRQHIPLIKKDTLSNKEKLQSLRDCWLFEKVNKFNKLQYFRPYESYRYIGEIVSENFENQPKIVFYMRKKTIEPHFHNESYLCQEGNEKQLLELFIKMLSNLSMSLQLISKLPQNMLISSFEKLNFNPEIQFTPTTYLLIVFARIIYILYSYKLGTIMKFQQISSELDQEQIEQQKEKLLQRTIQMILDGKANELNQKIIINCKCFTIQEKLQIRSQTKDLIQKDNEQKSSIKQKILYLIKNLGDLGFCETLISETQIFIINNRFIIEGKLLEHTNQSNQIVNVYSKFEHVIFFNQMIDLQLKQNQPESGIKLVIKTMAFNDEGKEINVEEREIKGSTEFLFALYNQIVATCRNILHFDTELLYQIQQNGFGNCKNFKSSISSKQSLKTKSNGLHHIPQKFVTFNITRNKQNESYQKILISNSKSTIFKGQSRIYQDQKSFAKEEFKNNEEVEVYSRKSSKRSIRSSVSNRKEVKKHHQNDIKSGNDPNSNFEKEESSSLIPSRKSIYLQNRSSQLLEQQQSSVKLAQQGQLIEQINELKTQDIIKSLGNEEGHHKQSEKSIQSREQVVVITNQQRKSRKQMPKRRSSREKDK